MRLHKPSKYWAVRWKSGEVAHWSFAGTKKEAIAAFLGDGKIAWAECYATGTRAVKIIVTLTAVLPPKHS